MISMTDLQRELFSMQDLKYKNFNTGLIPTVNPETVIGVRTPELRRFARDFAKSSEAAKFLRTLPHTYHEENNLHAFVIETIKDYDECMSETELFLPYIDNWATCDIFSPKIFKRNPEPVYERIRVWMGSEHVYTVRYAIGLLLSNYLDDRFKADHLKLVSEIRSDEYYVNMMIAWYIATALAKQYDAAIPYITEYRLDRWVHNKAIQKAVESRRIADELKIYLKTLRVKRETCR